MINLIDGNNWARIAIEADYTGLPIRTMMTQLRLMDGPTIVVWDGPNSRKFRQELYPRYKAQRQPLHRDSKMFFEMAKGAFSHCDIAQVELPNYEADDVIANLARFYAKMGHKVAIHSRDWDFAQLSAEYPNSIFCGYDPANKPCSPEFVVAYKVLVGDSSDNIPGVPRFGRKSWAASKPKALRELLKKILTKDKFHEQAYGGIQIGRGQINWIENNIGTLRIFHDLVSFFPIDMDVIMSHTLMGVENFEKADAFLKEFMQ